MKDYKCKSGLVNNKVDDVSVAVNPCDPVDVEFFDKVVEADFLANYNCVKVRLQHPDDHILFKYHELFMDYAKLNFSVVLLQRFSIFVAYYTIVSNKDLHRIYMLLADFQESMLKRYKDLNFEVKF